MDRRETQLGSLTIAGLREIDFFVMQGAPDEQLSPGEVYQENWVWFTQDKVKILVSSFHVILPCAINPPNIAWVKRFL